MARIAVDHSPGAAHLTTRRGSPCPPRCCAPLRPGQEFPGSTHPCPLSPRPQGQQAAGYASYKAPQGGNHAHPAADAGRSGDRGNPAGDGPGAAADEPPATAEPRGAPLGSDFYIGGLPDSTPDSNPAIAWNNPDHEYLVVWRNGSGFPSGEMQVYGQRVSEAGVTIGGRFVITGTSAEVNYSAPAAAWNETVHQYLVVWSDDRKVGSRGADIWGQLVSRSDERVEVNFRISGGQATADDAEPAGGWNAETNQYLVVWQDRRGTGGTYDI